MAVNGCPVCLHKQRRIEELEEEVKNLRTTLRYQERQGQEGFFGSSTPSSKLPLKPNSEEKEKKPRGAGKGKTTLGNPPRRPMTAIGVLGFARKLCPISKRQSFTHFYVQHQLDMEGPFLTRSGVTIGDSRDKIHDVRLIFPIYISANSSNEFRSPP
jgi:hypothetical protein